MVGDNFWKYDFLEWDHAGPKFHANSESVIKSDEKTATFIQDCT